MAIEQVYIDIKAIQDIGQNYRTVEVLHMPFFPIQSTVGFNMTDRQI